VGSKPGAKGKSIPAGEEALWLRDDESGGEEVFEPQSGKGKAGENKWNEPGKFHMVRSFRWRTGKEG